jgi:hypothetical protein
VGWQQQEAAGQRQIAGAACQLGSMYNYHFCPEARPACLSLPRLPCQNEIFYIFHRVRSKKKKKKKKKL